jgi:hypothetical protein
MMDRRSSYASWPEQPADDVAAEDVEQLVVDPLDRTQELGDIPAPDLVGAGGEQFRLQTKTFLH